MEAVLKRLGLIKDGTYANIRVGVAVLMILFFLVFGALSLFMLINSAA
jgi:hypothetical protein